MMGDEPYKVGPGKPPLHSRIKPGEKRNPGGKTSEQKKAELRAGELAAQIQMKMLEALQAAIESDPDRAISAIAADPLKLIKDAMDREFGTPVQRVDAKSSLTINISGDDADL